MKYRLCLFAKSRLSLCAVSNIDDSECGAIFYLYRRFRVRASFYFMSCDSVIFANTFCQTPEPCTMFAEDLVVQGCRRNTPWTKLAASRSQRSLGCHSIEAASNRAIGPRKNSISRNLFKHRPSCRRG